MTYRLPTLNTLRAFEAAARHLSFKTAATEIGVTPGAISQQVKKLEASLDVQLFRRLPHGLLLTSEGEAFWPRISKIFEDLTDATEAIAPKINSKKFNVGLSSEVQNLLPAKWPMHDDELKPHVRDLIVSSDVQMVHDDEVDCLIRLGGGPYGELALISLPVTGEGSRQSGELHFICKPGLAGCRQSKAILDDLKRHISQN